MFGITVKFVVCTVCISSSPLILPFPELSQSDLNQRIALINPKASEQVVRENEATEFSQSGTKVVPEDLTGLWKNDAGQVVYFDHEGYVLKSRFTELNSLDDYVTTTMDFRANVQGKLAHGAQMIQVSAAILKKCSLEKWVGFGFTINDDYTKLTGFRADNSVDVATCEVKPNDPITVVYTRMLDSDGNPIK